MSNSLKLVQKKSGNNTVENKTRTINLHELPNGKHPFMATVNRIVYQEDMVYCDTEILTPYLYIKDLKIFISGAWFDVDCSGNSIRIQIGKRIAKSDDLFEGDIIRFDAHVDDCSMQFELIEGKDNIDEYGLYFSPFAILPKNYKGNIRADIRITPLPSYEFGWNVSSLYDAIFLDSTDDFLHYTENIQNDKTEFIIEVQKAFYNSKKLKNFSNLFILDRGEVYYEAA